MSKGWNVKKDKHIYLYMQLISCNEVSVGTISLICSNQIYHIVHAMESSIVTQVEVTFRLILFNILW
jgi:hypothetical protein